VRLGEVPASTAFAGPSSLNPSPHPFPIPLALAMPDLAKPQALRILLVEDNPSDVFLLRTALVKAGLSFELMVLPDGEKALQHVERLCRDGTLTRPDIILLDLNLPKHTGLEVLQVIRKTPSLRGVPVAIYTSSDSPEDRSHSTRLGVNCYIVKPSQLKELSKVAGMVSDMGRVARSRSDEAA